MIRHFIDIDHFSKKDLDLILNNSKKFKKNNNKFINLFKNKSLALFFQKESNRTRLSFNIGMQKFGGNVIDLNSKSIGFGKRESEEDILRVLAQYVDCLLIRNNSHDKIKKYAELNVIPIINGLSNYSHPCQILSDIFTLKEKFNIIKNIKICWMGDYNNVLRSLIHAQKIFSFELNVILPKEIIKKNESIIEKINQPKINFSNDIKKNLRDCDCVMTDVWISMGEKNLKKKKYFKNFQINKSVMKFAKKNAIFMHCLPANRGEEVTDEVIDGSQSVVLEQARNRLYVQQAILNYILNKN